jgi:DNA-binding transcriptional regulator YiaG
MDAGLQIKELAEMIGVTPDTVINWELRGTQSRGSE